jgi:hypothetical protein
MKKHKRGFAVRTEGFSLNIYGKFYFRLIQLFSFLVKLSSFTCVHTYIHTHTHTHTHARIRVFRFPWLFAADFMAVLWWTRVLAGWFADLWEYLAACFKAQWSDSSLSWDFRGRRRQLSGCVESHFSTWWGTCSLFQDDCSLGLVLTCWYSGNALVMYSRLVGMILSWDTSYSESSFSCISSVVQANSGIIQHISPWTLPSKFILIHHSPNILPFDAVQSESLAASLSEPQTTILAISKVFLVSSTLFFSLP